MTWTKNAWQQEVSINLFEIACIPFQKELWLAKIPGCQSDFNEVVNRFDGCGIPDHLNEFIKDDFLNQEQAVELEKLSSLINETGEFNSQEEFEKLWSSELWQQISRLAGEIFTKHYSKILQQKKGPHTKWLVGNYLT